MMQLKEGAKKRALVDNSDSTNRLEGTYTSGSVIRYIMQYMKPTLDDIQKLEEENEM